MYVIEEGPSSGRLDVPVGVDLGSNIVRYFPDPDFEGTDQIIFSVHDPLSAHPITARATQPIELNIATSLAAVDEAGTGLAPALTAPSTFFEVTVGEAVSVSFEVSDAIGGPAQMYATGLPAGLTANAETGTVSGIVGEEGVFDVQLVAVDGSPELATTLDVTWIVNPAPAEQGLTQIADMSSALHGLSRMRVADGVGRTFEVQGLPPGIALEPSAPIVSGAPTQIGEYAVTVTELVDGDVVDEATFTWVVRPTTAIDFAL